MQGRQNATKCHWFTVTSAGLEVCRVECVRGWEGGGVAMLGQVCAGQRGWAFLREEAGKTCEALGP